MCISRFRYEEQLAIKEKQVQRPFLGCGTCPGAAEFEGILGKPAGAGLPE
ncbi:MAG: hypothetical protein ACLR8P_12120 [Clostridium fessum]